MHRIRAGVTGLGLVFLVTLIGSITLAPAGRDAVRDEPGEPLAELGVAPSPGDRAGGSDGRAQSGASLPQGDVAPQVERPIVGRRSTTDRPDQVVI